MNKLCIRCRTPIDRKNPNFRKMKYCSLPCFKETLRGTPDDFWAKVDRRGPDECWPWKASTYKKKGKQMGYGRHAGSGPFTYAHRCAWIFTHGPILDGRLVMHKCDNVLCCNPAHLRIGTDQDNNDDKLAKARHWGHLTPDDVREIRRKAADGISDKVLAAEYNTVPRYIWGIRTRRSWKSVE